MASYVHAVLVLLTMATTATIFAPTPRFFPYAGIDDNQKAITGIPRGEIAFSIIAGAVTVAAAAEFQSIAVTCLPPPSYAYVVREIFASYSADDADDWSGCGLGNLSDAEAAGARLNTMIYEMFANGAIDLETVFLRNWTPQQLPKQVVYPTVPNGSIFSQNTFANPVADGSAGTFTFNARFLQFDIAQANHYAVNYPLPVR